MEPQRLQTSRLTTKYQATIPEKVRQFLGLKSGDAIGFEIKKNKVIIKKIPPLDYEFAKSLEGTLSEWNSKNDEEAYGDL